MSLSIGKTNTLVGCSPFDTGADSQAGSWEFQFSSLWFNPTCNRVIVYSSTPSKADDRPFEL